MQWPAKSNNITNIVLNGTSQGTVTGNVTVPGTNLTLSPTINANSSTSVGQINLKGASDVEKVKTSLSTTLYTSLKDLTTKSLTSAAATLVTKLFSGIFGGKSGSAADNVNLKVNTTIAMTGTLTNSTLLESVAFAIPGYSQTATTSLTPIYNGIMGVFYPSFKPSVTQTQYITPQVNSSGATIASRNQYAYTINPADLKFDINPAVTAIATVNLVGSDIILNYNPTFDYIGQLEQVGTTSYWTGSSLGLNDGSAGVVGIRVTFDVIPNNGRPKSVIVKTFAANIKKVVVHETAGNEPW